MAAYHRCMLLITVVLLVCGHQTAYGDINEFSCVQSLNSYFEIFFATNQSITSQQWFAALPTTNERLEMKKLIKQVFQADIKKECSSSMLGGYPSLKPFIDVTLFKGKYCVIHELLPPITSADKMFKRFWGYTVISAVAERVFHHSAAHFQSDGGVCNEAAAVFEKSASRSLVIAGANRYAVIGQEKNKCQPKTALADAAHNNETMFHTMNEAVYEFNNHNHNIFIQWHGMAETSCANIQAFISAGVGGSAAVYNDSMITANRLVHHFNERFGGGAYTPATSNECNLLATTNIFGRYINGVPADKVCYTIAEAKNINGSFVHIEQKASTRAAWDLWAKIVIDSSAPPSHAIGLFTILSVIAINM